MHFFISMTSKKTMNCESLNHTWQIAAVSFPLLCLVSIKMTILCKKEAMIPLILLKLHEESLIQKDDPIIWKE